MNIDDLIANVKQTSMDLGQTKGEEAVVCAFEKTCEEFKAKLDAIRSLAGKKRIEMEHDWTNAKIVGFILCGEPHAWPWNPKMSKVYEGLLDVLKERDNKVFSKLGDYPEFNGARGGSYIARDSSRQVNGKMLSKDVFVETNLNNEMKRKNIKKLLNIYKIETSEVQFFLHH